MSKFAKDTGELLSELKSEKNPADWRKRNQDEFIMPLHEFLGKLMTEKHLTKQEVIERSGLNREYGYHILSGTRKKPSRQKILALAVAMGLDLDEVQYLLRYAQQGVLYPRNQWDAVIISAIEQNLSVMQTNELLHSLGETVLLE